MNGRAGVILALALALFVALAGFLSGRLGTWHEEVSVYPSPGRSVVTETPEGAPQLTRTCRGERGLVVSRERPVLSLCVGERSMPVMVSSYFAGWLYWPAELLRPLHHDNVLRLRWFGVALGVLELLSAWSLLRRLTSDVEASVIALVIAASTPYVYVHALLVHYEFVPWMFLGAALLVVTPRVTRARFILFAALAGLALAGNIKTVFLLVPIALYAWRSGAIPRASKAIAVLIAMIPLLPLVWFAARDPSHGFRAQVAQRATIASRKLLSTDLLREPLNLLQYWSDVASYGDQLQGLARRLRWTWVPSAAALVHVVWHAIASLRRRPHDRVAAVCGYLIVTYMVVVVLMYDQQPEANYAPLHTVLGAATGALAVSIGRRYGTRALFAATAFASVAYGYNVVKRGDPAATLELPFNLHAQQTLARRLIDDRRPGDIVTTTYNLAGVPDSVSSGRVHSVQVHPYFSRCGGMTPSERAPCVEEHWRRLIASPDLKKPLTIVTPAIATMVDEDYVVELLPALDKVVVVEMREELKTARGVPVLIRTVVH